MTKKSGQALVEFALLIPLLALLLFAIIQYALIFNTYVTLRHAAQVTSRTLSLGSITTNSWDSIAKEALMPPLVAANLQTPVGVNTNAVVGGKDAVQVTLTYDMPLIISFVVPNASDGSLTLTAVAIDRKF